HMLYWFPYVRSWRRGRRRATLGALRLRLRRTEMKLDGLHHITMITGDAQRNVDFYADLLGLRLVKTTVNFDAPEAYHLYFGDETGAPGSILTWFEFAGAPRGRAGAGMIHTLELGVGSPRAFEFWS